MHYYGEGMVERDCIVALDSLQVHKELKGPGGGEHSALAAVDKRRAWGAMVALARKVERINVRKVNQDIKCQAGALLTVAQGLVGAAWGGAWVWEAAAVRRAC